MQIAEHIHALKIPFQLTLRPGVSIPRFVYVYLICDDSEVWLVDTGVAGSERTIFDYMKSLGRDAEEISLVIQTHSHPDHIGATQAVRESSGCRVAIHEAERGWIEDVELQQRQRPVPGFQTLVAQSVTVDRILHDGDVLRLENGPALKVLHTPGHSPGSISLWCPNEKVLICGDAVPLPGGIPIYEDAVESVESLRKLLAVEQVEVLLSSWDHPRRAQEVNLLLAESLDYLYRIHEIVRQCPIAASGTDPLDLCGRVLTTLELPAVAATPLVARTFMAHVATQLPGRPGDAR